MGTNSRMPEAVSSAVSEELRVLRARLPHETVRALSERCGVPYSTLHKTLAGDRMIDVEELHKVATALGTTASEVLRTVEERLAPDELAAKRSKRGPRPVPRVQKKAARKDDT